MTTTWGAVFGDGWNGSLINPLTRAETAARESSTWHRVDGRRRHSAEPKGDAGDSTSGSGPASAPSFSRPAFGQWWALLERAGTGWIELTDAGAHDLPTTRSDEPPWRTPRPLASGGVAGSQRTISGR
jgi:hypothetical protein